MSRVRWTGLNIRDVTRLCRDLVAKNGAGGFPVGPWIWFVGRSRIEPEKNIVRIRTPGGVLTVRAGDEIVRREDGTFEVDRAEAKP